MQKISTRIFIGASIAFGVFGLLLVIFGPGPGQEFNAFSLTIQRLLFASVVIILPSFALAVAAKYLSNK